MDTLQAAYAMAKKNNGAPGIDGVTFEDIEARGAQQYIERKRAMNHVLDRGAAG